MDLTEMSKKRTLWLMEQMSSLPREELATTKHDKELAERAEKEGHSTYLPRVAQVRKVVLAGKPTRAYSHDEIIKICRKLPMVASQIVNGVSSEEKEKVKNWKKGKARKYADERYKENKKNPKVKIGSPYVTTAFKDAAAVTADAMNYDDLDTIIFQKDRETGSIRVEFTHIQRGEFFVTSMKRPGKQC